MNTTHLRFIKNKQQWSTSCYQNEGRNISTKLYNTYAHRRNLSVVNFSINGFSICFIPLILFVRCLFAVGLGGWVGGIEANKMRIDWLQNSVQVSACEFPSETISNIFAWCLYQTNPNLSWSLDKACPTQLGKALLHIFMISQQKKNTVTRANRCSHNFIDNSTTFPCILLKLVFLKTISSTCIV